MAADHLHPEGGVAFHRIVGFHLADHRPHPVHHCGEIDPWRFGVDAEFPRPAQVSQQAGGADQGLGGHAAGVEAVAAHLVALDQGHFGLHGGGDVGGDQAAGPGADDDEVAVVAAGLAQRVHASAPPQLLPWPAVQP